MQDLSTSHYNTRVQICKYTRKAWKLVWAWKIKCNIEENVNLRKRNMGKNSALLLLPLAMTKIKLHKARYNIKFEHTKPHFHAL
jgi:hypothetical protein